MALSKLYKWSEGTPQTLWKHSIKMFFRIGKKPIAEIKPLNCLMCFAEWRGEGNREG
jgi:hypothetical protein